MSVAVRSSHKHFCLQTWADRTSFERVLFNHTLASTLVSTPYSSSISALDDASPAEQQKKKRTPSLYQIKLDFKLE